MLAGGDPTEEHPLLAWELRTNVRLNKARLYIANSKSIKLERQGQVVANYFAVEVLIPNPDGSLLEGMTGTAKITGERASLAWQWGRGFWRWVRLQVW